MSSPADNGAQCGLTGDPAVGPPGYGSSRPVPAAPAAGGRPRTCPHLPLCPPPQARDCLAARIIAGHPEQGWSLLCNGVVVFEDTGALLPGGLVMEPGRARCHAGAAGVTQAGHARTVGPVPPGRARERGLRRPGRLAGVASAISPSGWAPGSRQHSALLPTGPISVPGVPPAGSLQHRMAAGAW